MATEIRWKVIVLSACHAGSFMEPLQDPGTLFIAAARADRRSFGCADENDFTYFGRAFFKESLPSADSLEDAFARATKLVREWEERNAEAPAAVAGPVKRGEEAAADRYSLPQIDAPEPIRQHLKRWRDQLPAKGAQGGRVVGRARSAKLVGHNGNRDMPEHRIFSTVFGKVYPLYVQKAERKGRTRQEVDEVICWLTGYSAEGLQQQIDRGVDFDEFFAKAPALHPNRSLIRGAVCGVRVEEVEHPLMQNIRYLDKLVDELAKGRKMAAILRG